MSGARIPWAARASRGHCAYPSDSARILAVRASRVECARPLGNARILLGSARAPRSACVSRGQCAYLSGSARIPWAAHVSLGQCPCPLASVRIPWAVRVSLGQHVGSVRIPWAAHVSPRAVRVPSRHACVSPGQCASPPTLPPIPFAPLPPPPHPLPPPPPPCGVLRGALREGSGVIGSPGPFARFSLGREKGE